jgi:hypothetical protein
MRSTYCSEKARVAKLGALMLSICRSTEFRQGALAFKHNNFTPHQHRLFSNESAYFEARLSTFNARNADIGISRSLYTAFHQMFLFWSLIIQVVGGGGGGVGAWGVLNLKKKGFFWGKNVFVASY